MFDYTKIIVDFVQSEKMEMPIELTADSAWAESRAGTTVCLS